MSGHDGTVTKLAITYMYSGPSTPTSFWDADVGGACSVLVRVSACFFGLNSTLVYGNEVPGPLLIFPIDESYVHIHRSACGNFIPYKVR